MSKPSPEELGSPQWQNQKKVSTYLRQLELMELQLEAYAQLPDWILGALEWSPHPVWNWPQSAEDPKVWQALWERWAFGQQSRYRELIPGQTPETPVTDAIRQPVKIDNDTGPAPPTDHSAPVRQSQGGMITLQSDEDRAKATATGKTLDLIDEHRSKPNRIVRSY